MSIFNCLAVLFIGTSLVFTLLVVLKIEGLHLDPEKTKTVKKNAWILTGTAIGCGLLAFLGMVSDLFYTSWPYFFFTVQLVFSAIFALKVERLLSRG